MPKPRALSPEQARRTLVHRFNGRADRLRQLAVNIGARPYRVFLVWTRFSGDEVGEGKEVVVRRQEILPAPRVRSLDAQTFSSFSAGVFPVGALVVDRVSGTLTYDNLVGLFVPTKHEDDLPSDVMFYYEVVEDGRGESPEQRPRYRLLGVPFRQATKVQWVLRLERTGGDEDRRGVPMLGGGRLNPSGE